MIQQQERADSTFIGRIQSSVPHQLDIFANFLERRSYILIPILFLFYLWVLKSELIKPLWHDELYTYYIAQAHTFAQMIAWTRTIDLNPPLYYIAARLTFHGMHPGGFSVRFPSMVAYFVATLCLYQFVRRRLSPLYGLLAGLVLLSSPFNLYSYEARPYAFILGFLGILVLGWQRAIDEDKPRSWLALLLVVLGGFGMLLSHVLASIAYAALLLTEFIRYLVRRKPDWVLWICLAIPLSACVTYFQPIQHHDAGAFPRTFQASLIQLLTAYSDIWTSIASLLGIALILILLTSRQFEYSTAASNNPEFKWPEKLLAFGLLCVPLVITALFMRSHSAYFPRYGIPAAFGAGILVPWFVSRWTNSSSRAALICSVFFIFGIITPLSIARHLQKFVQPENETSGLTGRFTEPLTTIMPNLPLVDASGLTFLEMNNRENRTLLSRTYYLSDPDAAIRYANATIFEGLPYLKTQFPIQANVVPYQLFIRQHSTFLVLGTYNYPEDWLLRKLLADHAILRFLGDFATGYKDEQLYEVTITRR